MPRRHTMVHGTIPEDLSFRGNTPCPGLIRLARKDTIEEINHDLATVTVFLATFDVGDETHPIAVAGKPVDVARDHLPGERLEASVRKGRTMPENVTPRHDRELGGDIDGNGKIEGRAADRRGTALRQGSTASGQGKPVAGPDHPGDVEGHECDIGKAAHRPAGRPSMMDIHENHAPEGAGEHLDRHVEQESGTGHEN